MFKLTVFFKKTLYMIPTCIMVFWWHGQKYMDTETFHPYVIGEVFSLLYLNMNDWSDFTLHMASLVLTTTENRKEFVEVLEVFIYQLTDEKMTNKTVDMFCRPIFWHQPQINTLHFLWLLHNKSHLWLLHRRKCWVSISSNLIQLWYGCRRVNSKQWGWYQSDQTTKQ